MPTGRLFRKILYCLIPAGGILITLLTGFLANNYYSYGFPVPWKTLVAIGICPVGWLEIVCSLRLATSYDWAYFALDAIFYAGIGYGLLLLSANVRKFSSSEVGKPWSMITSSLKTRLRWKELATPFRVSTLIGVVGGLYPPLVSPWLAIVSSFFSGVQPQTSGSFNIVSVAALAVFVAVPLVSIGGAVALLTLSMNDDRRGIVSFFVTVFSLLPLLYLGLEIFGWIMLEWQFAIIAAFWSVLLFLTARTMLRRSRAGS